MSKAVDILLAGVPVGWILTRGLRLLLEAKAAAAAAKAASTATRGAEDAANGVRLQAQLTGEEIAAGHAYQKHVIEQAEFPGISSQSQFAAHIENVVISGEKRTLDNGRTAYWYEGTVVIRNPRDPDGGTAFRPTNGYDYFLGLR